MATITQFEDLEVWQIARKLNEEIFPLLEMLEERRSYKLKEQLAKAKFSEENIKIIIRACEKVIDVEQQKEEFRVQIEVPPKNSN